MGTTPAPHDYTETSLLAGAAGFTVGSGQTLTLDNAASTFSGTVKIQAGGTLKVGLLASNGSAGSCGTGTAATKIDVTGTLDLNGCTASGSKYFAPGITLRGGTLTDSSGLNAQTSMTCIQAVDIQASSSISNANRLCWIKASFAALTVSAPSNLIVTKSGAGEHFVAALSGSNIFRYVLDAGSLTFGGAATSHTGMQLEYKSNTTITLSFAVTINRLTRFAATTGATLALGANSLTLGNTSPQNIDCDITGSGRIIIGASCAVANYGPARASWTGGYTIGNSTAFLRLRGGGLGNNLSVTASGTLATDVDGAARTFDKPITVNTSQTLKLDGGYSTLTLTGAISGNGGIATASSGLVVVTGTHSFAGTLSANGAAGSQLIWNATRTGASGSGAVNATSTLSGTGTASAASGNWSISGTVKGGDKKQPTVSSYAYTETAPTGTLTLTGVAVWQAGSKLDVETDGASACSLVNCSGGFGATVGSNITVNIKGALNAGTYTLISYASTLPGALPVLGTNLSGRSVALQWTAGVGLQAVLT